MADTDTKAGDVDEQLFVTEHHCFADLVSGLTTPCQCGTARLWNIDTVQQVSYVISVYGYIYPVMSSYYCVERTCFTSPVCVSALSSKTHLVKFAGNSRTLLSESKVGFPYIFVI